MGGIGPIAIIDNPTNTFQQLQHSTGKWRTTMVSPVQYKMRGWNATTSQYEYWQTDNPLAGPPSGASLVTITIAAIVVNSFPTSS